MIIPRRRNTKLKKYNHETWRERKSSSITKARRASSGLPRNGIANGDRVQPDDVMKLSWQESGSRWHLLAPKKIIQLYPINSNAIIMLLPFHTVISSNPSVYSLFRSKMQELQMFQHRRQVRQMVLRVPKLYSHYLTLLPQTPLPLLSPKRWSCSHVRHPIQV